MTTFEELGLDDELLQGIDKLGYQTPTPIQSRAIPILLSGIKDFVGLAQTGTGKTAAFGLPLLQLIDPANNYPQALIICPTRELCVQINNDLTGFKKFKDRISTVAVYGGASISAQINSLKKGIHVVVATPGRLIDLIKRRAIDLNKVKYLVLDEADEMLNMGFREDIDFVLLNTPNRMSAWLFSATMPREVRIIANRFMTSPDEVTIGKRNSTNTNIEHQFFVTAAYHRFEALKRLIDFNPDIYGIIFARTKAGAQEITDKLNKEGYALEAIHGDLSQQQRDRVMRHFREKSIQLLVATDVAARGIDVDGITHVINYELPDDPEVYTHRSGRTGRAGNKGICLSICHSRELSKIRQIEALIRTVIKKTDIPSAKDIFHQKFDHFSNKLIAAKTTDSAEIEDCLNAIADKFADITKEEILKKIVALEMSQFLKYYEDAEDLNIRKAASTEKGAGATYRKKESGKGTAGFSRLFINLGTKDGLYKSSLLQFILNEGHLQKNSIGRIDMKDINTWVEVDDRFAPQIIKRLNGKKFKGRTIRMNESEKRFNRHSRHL